MSYLNEAQCRIVLQSPHFSQPFTVSWADYFMYRGHTHVSILTMRFNLSNPLDYPTLLAVLRETLMFYFVLNSQLRYSIDYDVLLSAPLLDGTLSYYIWRANSNRHRFNRNTEVVFQLTHPNIRQLGDVIMQDHLEQAIHDFGNSKVTVVRLLAVVVSVMSHIDETD